MFFLAYLSQFRIGWGMDKVVEVQKQKNPFSLKNFSI